MNKYFAGCVLLALPAIAIGGICKITDKETTGFWITILVYFLIALAVVAFFCLDALVY